MKFLAMKLAEGFDASSIAPIEMTYPGTTPMVPIELTAVGAQPDMSVLVFIADNQRWQAGNYANFRVDPADVRLDPNTNAHNYRPLLAWLIDERGGEAFATEFEGTPSFPLNQFGPDAELSAWLSPLAEAPWVTRLHTRLSASEMQVDPWFEPSEGGSIPFVLDLSSQPPVETCLQTGGLATCGDTYCGPGASCALWALGEGCECPSGTAARLVADPSGINTPTIYCEEVVADLFADPDLALPDVCEGVSCGAGACVGINGIAACVCDEGFAAFESGAGAPIFEDIDASFGPDQLVAPVPGSVQANPQTAAAALLGLLLLLPLMSRRR